MKFFLALLIMLVISLQNSMADNLSGSSWDPRYAIRIGLIDYDLKGEFSSTKEGREDIEVDLDDLDLDEDKTILFLGGHIRFTDRWRLRYEYYHYDDRGSDTSEVDFEFDDVIVNVGTQFQSKLDFELYVLNLSYDFYRTDRSYFGIGVGAHVIDFKLEVSTVVNAGGSIIESASEDEDITAPLPNLFAGGAYAIKDNLIIRYGAGWMSMSYDDYEGDLVFAQGSIEYYPLKNFGMGVGYGFRNVDVEYETDNKKETYDVELPGPMIFLTTRF